MTETHRRENITRELVRAERALRASRHLVDLELTEDAISRAYYGMLHCARALLLSEGLEPRTHSGVAHEIYVHFVRSARLTPEVAACLRRLQADREQADYDSASVFTTAQAQYALQESEEFRQACLELLRDSGYLD